MPPRFLLMLLLAAGLRGHAQVAPADRAAQAEKLERAKLRDLFDFRQSPRFTPAERALLAYLEEVTLTKTASDEVFAELQRHYSERDIVEITWLNASENYFNLLANPLGLTSGNLTGPADAAQQ